MPFQAHGLSGKTALKCTEVIARAMAKNGVHALKHGATGIRFTHLAILLDNVSNALSQH